MDVSYYNFTCNFCIYENGDLKKLKAHVNGVHFPENGCTPTNVTRQQQQPSPEKNLTNKTSSKIGEN